MSDPATDASIWLPDWKAAPYWHEAVPTEPAVANPLAQATDVLIVGSGYTGLNAAIETAGAGRDTLVLDKDAPGHGCSTRNGGQIGHSIKPGFETLAHRHGADRAQAILDESRTALHWIEDRIGTLGIDCDFNRAGRFHAAHSPQIYEALARHAEATTHTDGTEAFAVPRAEQRRELGSDLYHGGVVYPQDAGLHPARYHQGLLKAARDAGAQVIGHCGVSAIARTARGFDVQTTQGRVHARDVIVATNGYTGPATPWLRRRVIPIGSYIIATEELPADLMDRLFPTDRVISDTRKVVYYYRPSPDRRRVIFGGRVSAGETDPALSGPRLHEEMRTLFPELQGTRISHSWLGHVAYTFDEVMHVGRHEGVHYAMGYCGTGVSMASYLGMRLGQKVLGTPEGATAFDDLPFATRPFYTGTPWFLPPLVAWYRWRDRIQRRRA